MASGKGAGERMEPLLSGAELDALLSAFDPEAERVSNNTQMRRYNFRVPDKFSKDQLRTLLMLHDNFARGATTALSAHLRWMVQVNTETVEQMTFRQFSQTVAEPAILGVVAAPPLPSRMLWEIDPALAFALIDRVLGGPGDWKGHSRTLTDIEGAVVRRLMTSILGAWRASWHNVVDTVPTLAALETNPLFAQVASPDDIVLVITHSVASADRRAQLRACLPYHALEPVLPQLSAREWLGHEQADHAGVRPALRRHVLATEIPVSVELGRCRMTMRDLLSLREGHLLQLDCGPTDMVGVYVGGQLAFRGRPGTRGRRLAVTIEGGEDDQ